ncbi:uncharacterized protein LOC124162926 isoform X2 [Ischnura elegans]|uniref:uncharacterized protein LOC124162926 isoform X2 n=1 Tax=Ischnura elegans TaxID=197161 RepID=UPI001ED8BF7E|nr:uncharacterized protein LOC124162926 isoform X2 [Ischnura elegans]
MDLREFSLRFIDVLKLNPCLWNVNSGEYYNAEKKSEAIGKLIDVSLPFYEEADAEYVSRKVLHLKTVVRREHRKVEESRAPSGEATYVPSLWYYDKASFLAEKMTSLQSSDDEFEGDVTKADDNPQQESSVVMDLPPGTSSRQILPSPPTDTGLPRRFSFEETMRFLDLYEKQQCLWDPHSNNYKDPRARRKAHLIIAQKFGGDPRLSYLEVKNKIKGIRTIYSRELCKVMKTTGRVTEYRPTLAWFKKADSFLRDVRMKLRMCSVERVLGTESVTECAQDESSAVELDKSPPYSPEILEISSSSPYDNQLFPESSPYGQGFHLVAKDFKVEHYDVPVKETTRNDDRRVEMVERKPMMTIQSISGSVSNFKAPDPLQQPAEDSSHQSCFPMKITRNKNMHNTDGAQNDGWSYNEDGNEEEISEIPETPTDIVDLESPHVSSDEINRKDKDSTQNPRKSPKREMHKGKRKRTRKGKEECYESILKLLNRRMESSATTSSSTGGGDRFDLAARSWAASLRELGSEQQIYAERLINEVLFEARLGNLNRSVHLQQGSEPQASQFLGGSQNIQLTNIPFNHHHQSHAQKSYPHR